MKPIFLFLLVMIACSPKQTSSTSIASLHGTWKLSAINNELIDTSEYANGIPELTFNTVDKKVNGSTGCNRVSGNFTQEKKGSLTFLPLAATKMFCSGKGEQQFLEALQSVTHYKVESNKLILLSNAKEVMEFNSIE